MAPEELVARLIAGPGGVAAAAVFGALFGSFANVCILRIPRGTSIVRPPSHCFACGKPVRWYDNLPVVSWLLLRGRCRACGARFSARYLLVELGLAALAAATWILCTQALRPFDPVSLRLARFGTYLLFELTLVILAVIDLDTKTIPDRITYPAIPFFLLVGLGLRDVGWLSLAIGVALGYGVVRLISDVYYWLTRREGLGYGDGKLLAIVGGLFGWRAVLFSLFGGAVLGTIIGVTILTARRGSRPQGEGGDADEPPLRHVEVPFGPFLVAAALCYLFLQETIGVGVRFLFVP